MSQEPARPADTLAGSPAAQRPPLLFLCHRIPYPPDKGDKIRAFHLLHHLAQHFEVHLGSFVDDPRDWGGVAELEKHCASLHLRPLHPGLARLRSLRGLLTGKPLSMPFYADGKLAAWVRDTVSRYRIRHAIVYSAVMAQFLPETPGQRRVIDFVDVDSDKWRQYAARKLPPMRWVYAREARCLLVQEQELARRFDASLFVSAAEAALFRQLCPDVAPRIGFYNNGVNGDYFTPNFAQGQAGAGPYPGDAPVLVFTGAMDYWPNVDAVVWFVREVLPVLRADYPGLQFAIVGSKPTAVVEQLAREPGVTVSGRVPDVRPWVRHATAVVAPMRIARGVQNKVLEGMAMARPVLLSGKGLEGIRAEPGREVLLAETPDDYRRHLAAVLAGEHAGLGERARARVLADFTWSANLPEVVELLQSAGQDEAPRETTA